MNQKPWDAKLAFLLIKPFRNTSVSPNYFTTLRLIVGLFSAYIFSKGQHPNVAALFFALSHFLDHTDGELARLTGKTSRFGHYYDLACDAIVMILLFVSISLGLTNHFSQWSILMGCIAGISVSIIFQFRNIIENKLGKAATRQASFSGFEAEDILYLLPLVTLLNGLPVFLIAAAVGAPIGAIIVWNQYKNLSL